MNNTTKIKAIVTGTFAIAAALVWLALGNSSAPAALAAVDRRPAPAWSLKDLEGKTIQSSDFKDKVIILDFWATWCPPCRKEIPGFIELQRQYATDGLVVIGVSLDEGGPAVVKKFAAAHRVNYPLVMADRDVAKAYGGIEAIPTTFVIDRAGDIVAKHIGYADKSVFEKEIKPLLAQPGSVPKGA